MFLQNYSEYHRDNYSCAKLPSVDQIHINNMQWQELLTSNGTFYLYGAYYDNRPRNALGNLDKAHKPEIPFI